jgi:hypothetical protein
MYAKKPDEEMPSQAAENRKHEMPNLGDNFNWGLPILGALGFGFAFALLSAITGTNYEIVRNSWAHIIEDTPVSLTTGMFRGIITGVIGGGVMGFAYKDKTRVVELAIRCALGFGFAFSAAVFFSFILLPLKLYYLTAGAMIGLIAGLALGFRTETDGLVLSLLLGLVGAIWFAIAFLIGHVLPEHSCASWNAWAGFAGCSPWNGWAGAIGGTLFGTTFAMYDKSKRSQKLSKFTHKRTG